MANAQENNNAEATPILDLEPKERKSFVKVENGEITDTEIPEVGQLEDGRHVSGFDKLPDEILADMGWVPVTDPGPPVIDEETQTVQQDYVLEEKTGEVTAVYTVTDIPVPPPPEAPIQEQVESLFTLLVAKGLIAEADVAEIKAAKPLETT
jgi:hypothetical protein